MLPWENSKRKLIFGLKMGNKLYLVCSDVCMLSHIWLFVTSWTVVHQTPLSMEFSRQEDWSGLFFPSPRDQTWTSCIAGWFFIIWATILSEISTDISCHSFSVMASPTGYRAIVAWDKAYRHPLEEGKGFWKLILFYSLQKWLQSHLSHGDFWLTVL